MERRLHWVPLVLIGVTRITNIALPFPAIASLFDFLAVGRLTGPQKHLHQFALSANDHAGKSLNHFPSETTGSVSSHSEKSPSCDFEIALSRMRSSK